MSELDHSLHELGDDLRSTIMPPDLAQVTERARQRSVRRRMQVGAVAAVVAVSVAVPAMRLMPEAPPAAPAAEPQVGYEVDFADAEHGYALMRDCESSARSCTFTLLATTDGGRSWQERQLPKGDEAYTEGTLSVLDQDVLTFHRTSADPGSYATPFVSDDAGRTWREYGALEEVAPSPIPPGAQLSRACSESPTGTCGMRIVVARPHQGAISPAPTQPPLVAVEPGRVATAGGRYWGIGREPTSEGWAIAVTSDGGRTWATNPLDVPGEPTRRDPWSVVEHDGTLYAMVVGSVGANPVELLAVFRSTDQGRSWTRTWQPTEGHRLLNVFGDAVATADGRLLVYSTTEGTLESRDGQTFTKADRQLAGPVTWTRGGYLAEGENGYEISRDGLDWRRFELP